jgi:hypothetical protein
VGDGVGVVGVGVGEVVGVGVGEVVGVGVGEVVGVGVGEVVGVGVGEVVGVGVGEVVGVGGVVGGRGIIGSITKLDSLKILALTPCKTAKNSPVFLSLIIVLLELEA